MKKTFIYLCSIFIIVIVAVNCKPITEKNVKSGNYFKIKDVAFNSNLSPIIRNLDEKNGFKNIYLGSTFQSFNFNPNEWISTLKDEFSIKEVKKNCEEEEIMINNSSIEFIRLVFFKEILTVIEVGFRTSVKHGSNVYSVLEDAYGSYTHNLSTFKSDYQSLFKYSLQEEPINNEFGSARINNLSSPSGIDFELVQKMFSTKPKIVTPSFYKNSETGTWCRDLGHETFCYGWEGKKVQLKYNSYNKHIEDYGKDEKKLLYDSVDGPVSFTLSSEKFILMNREKCNEVLVFIHNVEKMQRLNEINEGEAIKKAKVNQL